MDIRINRLVPMVINLRLGSNPLFIIPTFKCQSRLVRHREGRGWRIFHFDNRRLLIELIIFTNQECCITADIRCLWINPRSESTMERITRSWEPSYVLLWIRRKITKSTIIFQVAQQSNNTRTGTIAAITIMITSVGSNSWSSQCCIFCCAAWKDREPKRDGKTQTQEKTIKIKKHWEDKSISITKIILSR